MLKWRSVPKGQGKLSLNFTRNHQTGEEGRAADQKTKYFITVVVQLHDLYGHMYVQHHVTNSLVDPQTKNLQQFF